VVPGRLLDALMQGVGNFHKSEKPIVTSNFQRIALRRENRGLYSSENWLSKTKFDLFKIDE
jgi:hypothetical protein